MPITNAFAAAKINLCLHVLGRRPDGYHDLESLVVFADIGDRLALAERGRQTNNLASTGAFSSALDFPEDNIITAAIAAFQRHYPQTQNVSVALLKNLPVAAGIGGGSSDAAACLRALCHINNIAVDAATITSIAGDLGADVPVCLKSQPTIMRGIGEDLSDLPDWPSFAMVLVNPAVTLSTAQIFAAYDGRSSGRLQSPRAIANQHSAIAYLKNTHNDLEATVVKIAPVVQQALDALARQAHVLHHGMSGSGATCFGLFSNPATARAAAIDLQKLAPTWWIRSAVSA